MESFIAESKAIEKAHKEKYKSYQSDLKEYKTLVENCRAERGKPEASTVAEIEEVLENFQTSKAAYHGGDFNGVSCRRIVGIAMETSNEVREILLQKRDDKCDNKMIEKKVEKFEQTLGLFDVAFSYLSIIYPTDDEKKKTREVVEALAMNWRDVGLRITLKTHVLEAHTCDFNDQ